MSGGATAGAPSGAAAAAPPTSPADRFRADLEGLRGVAVSLVVLFHARIRGFDGGFVGVDVFFVLSGFLITALLAREISASGRIDLADFYARRARRLLPAASVALVATLVASRVLMPSVDIADVARDGIAAALYVGNIRFAMSRIDYLAGEQDPSPLLHYWSLGVEEQFYLLWPAVVLLFAAAARRLGVDVWRGLAAAVGATLVASFAASLVITHVAPPWAFFSLPTRAWELAVGAALALGAGVLAAVPRGFAAPAAWAGVGAILVATFAFDAQTRFPGWAAVLPVVGAAAIIAFGETARGPGGILASGPLRWLGRISYSLYLWQWPLLLLPTAAAGRELSVPARVGLIALALVAGALSHRFVEEPPRRASLLRARPGLTLGLAGAATLASVVIATSIGLGVPEVAVTSRQGPGAAGEPSVGPDAPAGKRLLVRRLDPPRVYGDGCHLSHLETKHPACIYGGSGPTTIALVGDSHAAQWFPALELIATERGWRLLSLTKSGCSLTDIAFAIPKLKRRYTECEQWRRAIVKRLRRERPALLVVAASWPRTPVDPADRAPSRQAAALARSIASIGVPTAIIVDTPFLTEAPLQCLSRHPSEPEHCATARAVAFSEVHADRDREAARMSGATLVDLSDPICPGDPCPAIVGGIIAYQDRVHLSVAFARSLAARLASALPDPTQGAPAMGSP